MTLLYNTCIQIENYLGDGVIWNEYVESHQESRYCHLWQYNKVLMESYGFEPHYLIIKNNQITVGLLPFCAANSLFFGKILVSQPFSEYGGMLLDEIHVEDYKIINDYLVNMLRTLNCNKMEIHGNIGVSTSINENYMLLLNQYKYATLKINSNYQHIKDKVVDYQIRKALKKADNSGLECFQDNSLDIIQNIFWPLYLNSMKRLGSPPHTINYFINLKKYFGEKLKIFWVKYNSNIISGLMGFTVGKRIQITNIVSDEKYWECRPNDLAHWEFIKWGCENGYEVFDFGSVRYEGQLKYKKKWGTDIYNTGYYFIAENNSKIKTFSSSSENLMHLSKFWSNYMPISITKLIGPFIRKNLVR